MKGIHCIPLNLTGLISLFYGARVNYCPEQWLLIHNRVSKTDHNIRFHVFFPQVIGDKKASVTTARLHHEKGLHDLRKLEEALGNSNQTD